MRKRRPERSVVKIKFMQFMKSGKLNIFLKSFVILKLRSLDVKGNIVEGGDEHSSHVAKWCLFIVERSKGEYKKIPSNSREHRRDEEWNEKWKITDSDKQTIKFIVNYCVHSEHTIERRKARNELFFCNCRDQQSAIVRMM